MNLLAIDLAAPELLRREIRYKHNPISWFEIPVLDMARAVQFYQTVLQMKLENRSEGEEEMYFFPMNDFAKGASGSLVKVKDNMPSRVGTLNYFYTDNLDKSIRLVQQAGGKIVKKEDIGKYGVYINVIDTEGNRIGIHQER